MAQCKLCGKTVTAGVVLHIECWEVCAAEIAERICTDYCRWPYVCRNDAELADRCDKCVLVNLLGLGTKVQHEPPR